jgi:Fe-S-cluster formation regulator IscX/YfhJ
MFEIANHFIDEAGVYFVRVVISDTEAQFFTFDHYPTQEEVDTVAQRFVDARQEIEEIEDASPDSDQSTDA